MSEQKKMSRRTWLKAAGGVVAVAAVAGAGYYFTRPSAPVGPTQNATVPVTTANNPINIGAPMTLTGPYAEFGTVMSEGITMAASELNATGGILGRPVNVLIRDDQANPDVAATKVKSLVEDNKVEAIVGVLSSAVNLVVNDLVKQPGYQIPFMCSNMTEITMHASNVRAPMTAFPMSVNVAAATALIGAANKLWPNANYYTLDADYVWGHQMRDTILAAMKSLGGTEVGVSAFPVGTTDFSTLLTAAQSAKPDVLLCVAIGADQVNLAKQIISFGVQKTMNVVFPLTQQIVAYEAGGPATFQGIYCGTDWAWEVGDAGYPWSADAKKFSDAYWQRTGHPADPYSLGTYVGLKEYAAACERAGTTEANAVMQALGNHQFSYAKGSETWRPCDLQAIQDWFIVQGKTPEESQNEYDIFKVKAKAGTDNPDLYFQTPASLGCS